MSAKHLSPSSFHCPPLTRNEKQRFKELGIASAYELAKKAQISGGPMQWELDSNEHDLKLYVSNVAEGGCSSTPYLSTITVMGTMSEVLDLFRFQTTEEAKEYCRRFGTVSDDAVDLYSIVSVTPETPHEMIGISWHGFKTSIVDTVLPRRDACLLIVHHAFEFNGKNVWVRCVKSIDVPCCPESPDFVRMTLYTSGYVVTESDRPGFVHVAFVTHANVGGRLGEYASWFIDMSSRKRCRHLTAIDRFLREDRARRHF
ncbi:unnamed protein product [Aphanomyces euteiches]|nr:hypothetical protein Ae201684P_018080 [Aphanomyces euteiches]KAH9150018.1 hypothetical protein AeRB84_007068 [Aphanomyces euteiches]